MINEIEGKISNIEYTPLMCSTIPEYNIMDLDVAMKSSSFLLNIDNINKVAVSVWVSAKRSRSSPYARVYNTLNFSGKRITIIPVFKDEGLDGDRDYLQFDTIALMSLLRVHVIIAYYSSASKNKKYDNKITSQKYDVEFLSKKIKEITSSQQSDAIHWNIEETKTISVIGQKAMESYISIGKKLNVKMSNYDLAKERINEIAKSRQHFIDKSRDLALKAQIRESVTMQPKESVDGTKGIITIKNHLGGEYYFTVDETFLLKDKLKIIEAKHCNKENKIPSINHIKDGLLTMMLFKNLEVVTCNKKDVTAYPYFKLTNANGNFNNLSKKAKETIELLNKEAKKNKFNLIFQ